jgi:hypothetical protein
MLHTVLGAVGAVALWLAWELLGSAVAEVLDVLLRPITRPIWRRIVHARTPWPLALMLSIGVTAVVGSLSLMPRDKPWGAIGFLLFFAGSTLTLMAPLIWRDARVEAAKEQRHADLPRSRAGTPR